MQARRLSILKPTITLIYHWASQLVIIVNQIYIVESHVESKPLFLD